MVKVQPPYVSYAEARADSYPEKVDPEIVPLCDALNAAGFPTNASCWGHCRLNNGPHVTFFCEIEQAEALQRALREASDKDLTDGGLGVWQASLRMYLYPWGREWEIEVDAHGLYHDSPMPLVRALRLHALKQATAVIWAYARGGQGPIAAGSHWSREGEVQRTVVEVNGDWLRLDGDVGEVSAEWLRKFYVPRP